MKPCKKCKGSGVWVPANADDHDDTDMVARACIRCDGTGQVLTLEEERAEWDAEARRKRFQGRREEGAGKEKPTEASSLTADEWLAQVHKWWERDRAARIRNGACRDCGEKLCPKVGGRDRECVP